MKREVWRYNAKKRRFFKLDGVPQTVEVRIAMIDAASGDLPGVGWRIDPGVSSRQVVKYYVDRGYKR